MATTTLKTRIVGDTVVFTYTGKDADGAREDITGHTIDFIVRDTNGNSIDLTIGSGIVLSAQSGETLGDAKITIQPEDYPAAWLTLGWQEIIDLQIEVERVGNGFTTSLQNSWKLKGQLIP